MIEKGDYIDKEDAEDIEIPEHLVIKRVSGSTGTRGHSSIYHTGYCNRWPKEGKAISKEVAESWGYRECRVCAGTCKPTNADFSYQEALKEAAENE
jgi:hypothetical protein